MRVVGACLHPATGPGWSGSAVPLLGGLKDVADAVRDSGADTVAVAAGASVGPARLRRLSWELEGTDTDLVVAPGLMEVAGPRLHIRPMTGLPLLHVEEPEFAGTRRLVKAVVDRSLATHCSAGSAAACSPRGRRCGCTSPGPAIFQPGPDRPGRPRVHHAEVPLDVRRRREAPGRAGGAQRAVRGSAVQDQGRPAGHPVGRFLRRLSLDELPQLVNVLCRADVAGRAAAAAAAEVALYEDDVRRRLLVKPGLTGLWQISGRSDLTWEERCGSTCGTSRTGR